MPPKTSPTAGGPDNQSRPAADDSTQLMKYAEDVALLFREEKARRQDAETARQHLAAILDAVADPIASTDSRLEINSVNAAFTRLAGLSCESCTEHGRTLTDILPDPEFQELIGYLKSCRDCCLSCQISLPSLGGRIMRVQVTGLPDSNYVFVFNDVTGTRRAEQLREEILALLSHELRTPLNGILGFTQILRTQLDKWIQPEEAEYFELIEISGDRMLKAVTGLLKYADLNVGRLASTETVALASPLNRAVDLLETAAEGRGVHIDIDIPEELRIHGDSGLITDLFFHVLHNAVQFSPEGGRVTVNSISSGASVEVNISDSGPGIPGSELENVFRGFYQLESYLSRRREGLGLGLTLARRIARIHDGDIRLESRINKGTLCTVTLPLASENLPQTGQHSSGKVI